MYFKKINQITKQSQTIHLSKEINDKSIEHFSHLILDGVLSRGFVDDRKKASVAACLWFVCVWWGDSSFV